MRLIGLASTVLTLTLTFVTSASSPITRHSRVLVTTMATRMADQHIEAKPSSARYTSGAERLWGVK